MKAKSVDGAVSVNLAYGLGGEHIFETDCVDFDQFRELPQVVEFENETYVKTGWNSDSETAFYKTGRRVAKAV